jgi:class 3 adenylate cyclase
VPRLQAKSFARPDEVRTLPNVRLETVGLDDATVGHCRFGPGWRWSTDVGPMLGTSSCPIRHLGYTISGRIHVEMDDGRTLEIGPDTVFDIPPGHDKWVVGDEPWETIEWGASGRALEARLSDDGGRRTVATIVFTDIVGSTERLREVGDAAWHELLVSHNARLRYVLNEHGGREIKTTGDGILAIFEGPTRAVRSAVAMTEAVEEIGLQIRVGIHTGELELVGDDVRGIAVHAAARILALAGAGEVLVSATTHGLLEGSGIELEDAGEHELKGLAGKRRVYRVTSGTTA